MKLGYVIIYVDDVDATLLFYEQAFGFERRFLHESKMYGELVSGETTLAFAAHEMGELNLAGDYERTSLAKRPFGYEIGIVTEDVQSLYDRALAAGAVAVSEPKVKPWGQTVGYVRAAEGTVIEICSPMGE